MKLYKVTTAETIKLFEPIYVVSESALDAEMMVDKVLREADYGMYRQRQVINIELVAETNLYGAKGVLVIENTLIEGLEPKTK